jgi:hypothetical protein
VQVPSHQHSKSRCGLNTSWTSKLASCTIDFAGKIVFFEGRGSDNLPKEIKGKAKWSTSIWELQGNGTYYILVQGRTTAVEYINHRWYFTRYWEDIQRFSTGNTFQLTRPEDYSLGTPEQPYLDERDQCWLYQIAGTSGSQSNTEPALLPEEEDLPIGDSLVGNELSTELGAMTTTTVAHAQGGGVVTLLSENPMNAPTAVAAQMQPNQGGGGMNPPSGPAGGGEPLGGGSGPPLEGGAPPPGGGNPNPGPFNPPGLPTGGQTNSCIIGLPEIFNGNRAKMEKFEKEFSQG